MKRALFLFLLFFFPLFSLNAQEENRATNNNKAMTSQNPGAALPTSATEGAYPGDMTTEAVVLVFLALLPFIVMLLTSFLKMVITLSLLRSALGVQQIPPNQVINGIALILSIYVMFPTGMQMYNSAKGIIDKGIPKQLFSSESAATAIALIDQGKEPLREFMIRNTTSKHMDDFYKLTQKTFPDEVKGEVTPRDFIVVVPSFITSQIKSAFEIGVLIYLPFFVIDLVVANVLLAMQMMMLSPLSIALPLKLLLLVMIDGWTILLQGLVLSFN